MASKDENVIRLDVAPDKLLAVMIDADFHVERQKAIGSLEVRVEQLERTAERARFKVHTKDHARGVTGIDRSKTEDNQVEYDWNLKTLRASWTYQGANSGMARVWGTARIDPEGAGSRLTNTFEVEIKVPLLGGKLEKMVLKEVQKSWPRYEKTVRDFCARQA